MLHSCFLMGFPFVAFAQLGTNDETFGLEAAEPAGPID